jgi:hypothetical protein
MRNISILIITLFILKIGQAQDTKTLFHLYQPTASVSEIVKWNIKDTTNVRFIVKEEIDEFNRVTSIQYLMDGKVYDYNPMYNIQNIQFEYKDNMIIERYLDSKGNQLTFLDDETPSYREYYLNENNEIIDCKTIFNIEFDKISIEQFKRIEELLKFWRENVLSETDSMNESTTDECSMNFIYGYLFSYSKMNGIFPKKVGYNFDFDKYEMEFSKEIIKELKNKYKP